MTCIKNDCPAGANIDVLACRPLHVPCRLRLHVHDTDTIMPALITNTLNRQIISRSEASAPSVSAATPHQHHRIDADGDRLLSPHEIAILMVLASEPRRQQGDPVDLRCLVDRGLVRLDAASLAEAPACLSADGRQMVLRLARSDRTRQGRNVDVTTAFRAIAAETSAGIALHAAR
ncbi:hypothetical protein [Burkholderia sp. Bp9012]|uniref:hypothetical protein n=1 Tax=Burkholderia sp. Bp9012 TaxID=2184562 RepID=UPI0021AB5CF0|nr:hypothetical protein [Burkholderia sp. Bp9012]